MFFITIFFTTSTFFTNLFCCNIISLVLWPNTIFLLAMFAISLKYFVKFLKSPKYFGSVFHNNFFHNFNFFHQILVPILYHQNCSSFWTKGVAKRPLNHQILVYFWTKDELLKCSEKNNKQTKMTRQKTEEKHNNNNILSIYWN